MQNLELDLLRSFAAVADTGSFTAAADLVARTQSAVSMQIKRLEDILGRRVFERSSRSLALTPDGSVLLDYARRKVEPIWKEPEEGVAAEGFEDRDAPVPLVALPPGCVLRDFAMEALKKHKRGWRLAYTGSSMTSVQAAVLAGLGVSILPLSAVVPGMRILRGRAWPNPGALEFGVIQGAGARDEIVQALESVAREA